MFKSKRFWLLAGIVLVLLAGAGVVAARGLIVRRDSSAALFKVAQVTAITAITSVEGAGTVEARQSDALTWNTTGRVAAVNARVGDHVQAADVLITLDPLSAPQNLILAQADLIAAQKAYDELLRPSALTVANAQKAVADAQDALTKAQRELRNVENPAGPSLYDAVADANLALETARANSQLAQVSPDVSAYQNAVFVTNWYRQYYDDLKAKLDANPGNEELKDRVEQAYNTYQSKLNDQLTLQLRIETEQANKDNAVAKAQDAYDTARANLNNALQGPDANKLALAQAKAAVAQAALAEAQSNLDKLSRPDPDEVIAAQVRVQAAQAAVAALTIKAPFDGEVLVINYQPGDSALPARPAVVLADRSRLHVDASVDESDIGAIQVGDAVTTTFDALPGLTLTGVVAHINPVGETVQGLVKYTVRVDLASTDPRLLLGMTANVVIVTDVQPGALAVPLDAVQLDQDGEYVNRLLGEGRVERVNVVSSQTQDDLVVITGDLQPGDRVQVVEPQPTITGGPFGPG